MLKPQHHRKKHQSSVYMCLYVFIEWKHMGNWTTQTGFIKASGHSIPFYTLLARYEWGAISLPRARAFWSTLRSTSSAGKGHWHGNSMLFNTLQKDQTNRFIKWTSGKTWPSVHKKYYRDIHFIVKTCKQIQNNSKQIITIFAFCVFFSFWAMASRKITSVRLKVPAARCIRGSSRAVSISWQAGNQGIWHRLMPHTCNFSSRLELWSASPSPAWHWNCVLTLGSSTTWNHRGLRRFNVLDNYIYIYAKKCAAVSGGVFSVDLDVGF